MRSENAEVAKADLVMVRTSQEVAGLRPEPRLEGAVGEALGRRAELMTLNGCQIWSMDVLHLTERMRSPRPVLIALNPLSFAWLSEHLPRVNFVRSPSS